MKRGLPRLGGKILGYISLAVRGTVRILEVGPSLFVLPRTAEDAIEFPILRACRVLFAILGVVQRGFASATQSIPSSYRTSLPSGVRVIHTARLPMLRACSPVQHPPLLTWLFEWQ
jgi:hypothetical protein